MSELFAAPADPQVVVEDPEHVIEGVSRPPVVITEQAVAFSTAAAVALPRTKPTRRVIAALRGMFLSSSGDARPARLSPATIHRGAPPFRAGRNGTSNAQAVTAFLTLFVAMLLALAAIGEVRVVHHSRHAAP